MRGKEPTLPPRPRTGMLMIVPPVLSPIHAMDIPSVRRRQVSVMVPADRVSTHDLPLAETLSVVEGGFFHTMNVLV